MKMYTLNKHKYIKLFVDEYFEERGYLFENLVNYNHSVISLINSLHSMPLA